MVATTRADFEKLVDLRLREADILLAHQDWDGAYYLSGYAVEFALKVAVIGALMKSDGFPERRDADNFYRHDLDALRRLAELHTAMDSDPTVSADWLIARQWSEQSRYAIGKSEQTARQLFDAIRNGVVPWIRQRW